MKKTTCVLSVLILGVALSSAGACLFGNTLVEMARMSDLSAGPEIILTRGTVLPDLQKKQIVSALQKEWEDIRTIQDAFDYTDDGLFYVRRILDTLSHESYTMYIYSAGDNVHGFIFREATTEQVARIGDASIYDCRVSFQRYDYLPWFYSN